MAFNVVATVTLLSYRNASLFWIMLWLVSGATDHMVTVGASIGVALAPGDGEDSERLLKSADMALYRGEGKLIGSWNALNLYPARCARPAGRAHRSVMAEGLFLAL
jgi:GGDEF domain-containing protein